MNKNSTKWAFKVFILSISLSIIFSLVSQSLLPSLSPFFSIFVIVFFVFVSVIFDMVAVAFTSINKEQLDKFKNENGYVMAVKLCERADKVASFGGDVVGDICGILSGAGGVSLVVNINIQNTNLNLVVTCLVSSLIAGITIFCKAIMKTYALQNCEQIAIMTGVYLEASFFNRMRKKRQEKKHKRKKKKEEKQIPLFVRENLNIRETKQF